MTNISGWDNLIKFAEGKTVTLRIIEKPKQSIFNHWIRLPHDAHVRAYREHHWNQMWANMPPPPGGSSTMVRMKTKGGPR